MACRRVAAMQEGGCVLGGGGALEMVTLGR